MSKPRIKLQARNEGLSYEDSSGLYRFKLSRRGKTWAVHLPPTKGERFEQCVLSNEERARLLPNIQSYLSRIWWFGIWPVNYSVTFNG